MDLYKKEAQINLDLYHFFLNQLYDLKQVSQGEALSFFNELEVYLQLEKGNEQRLLKTFFNLKEKKSLDALSLAVGFYFFSKIFSRRKDFLQSLMFLKKSQNYLHQENKNWDSFIQKEIHILELACQASYN